MASNESVLGFAQPSAGAPEAPQQLRNVIRQWRLELDYALFDRVNEAQLECMQCLPPKRDRAQRVGPIDIPLLTHQRVTAEPCLDADLVSPPGAKTNFDERRTAEPFHRAEGADRLCPPRIARMRLLLNQGLVVPHQEIAPGPLRRVGDAVDHGSV